jgi:hypothetical protein
MTFPELFARYGYHRMCDACEKSGLSKAHMSNVWYGHDNLGANLGRKLSLTLGIPLAELLEATAAERPGRRGPRKPRP